MWIPLLPLPVVQIPTPLALKKLPRLNSPPEELLTPLDSWMTLVNVGSTPCALMVLKKVVRAPYALTVLMFLMKVGSAPCALMVRMMGCRMMGCSAPCALRFLMKVGSASCAWMVLMKVGSAASA